MKFLDLKSLVLLFSLWAHAAVAGFYPINGGMVNQASVVTSAGATTTLAVTSNQLQEIEGTSTQTVALPDATLLPLNWWYQVTNNSTQTVTVNDNAGALVITIASRQVGYFRLHARATAAGTWKKTVFAGLNDSGNLPVNAATADALSSTPDGCASGEFVTGIEADGDAICSTPVGSGDVSGPASSVEGEIALFSGVTGKISRRATPTGLLKAASGVLDVAVAGTDYQAAGDYITDLTGDVSASGPGSVAATVNEVGGETAADVATSVQDTQAATASNTNSTIVKRDGSGNFSAGTVTAALSGNATTSSALAANPTDCGANEFASAIAANGNLTCSSIPNAATTASASAGNSTIVARDGSGNFAAGTITAALSGNASTATALAANPTDCGAGEFANAIDASGNLTCDTPSGSSSTQQYCHWHTGHGVNAHGTTNNKIRNFATEVADVGSDMDCTVSDAASGASITIQAAGIYAIAYSDFYNSGSCTTGISKNSSQLTTAVYSITAADIMGTSNTESSSLGQVSAIFYATTSDVIRAHTDGTCNGTTGTTSFFIAKVRDL